MSKKVWTQPQAIAEQFVANEYVAVCWSIECLVPDNMKGGRDGFGKDTLGHQNGKGCCGDTASQYVQDAGEDLYKITEFSRFYGQMPCTVYPEGFDYTNHKVNGQGSRIFKLTDEDFVNGQATLYWTTESGNAKYYHYGVVDIDKTVKHS